MKITLNDVTNIDALSVINDNFDKIEQELQNKVLYRNNPDGEPNPIEKDIDVNGKNLLNVGEVFSSYGRWATINEVEEIKEEVLVNASQVSTDKTLTLGYRNSAEGFLNSTSALYDSFDDRYLGVKASDPSVDNDGNTLAAGALYFRSSGSPIMRVYNGTTWQDVGSITSTTTNTIDGTLYANQTEAEQGTNNTKVMTPLRTKQAIDKQVKEGFTTTGGIILPGNTSNTLGAIPLQQAESISTAAASLAVSDRPRILVFASKSTTSGVAIDFSSVDGTAIPSWAKKITVSLIGVSTVGGGYVGIRLGTGASPVFLTSGYSGCAWQGPSFVNFTDLIAGSAQNIGADIRHGSIFLTKTSGNTWVSSSSIAVSNAPSVGGGAFSVTLPDLLTAIRLTTHNSDIFDSGSVSLTVEG